MGGGREGKGGGKGEYCIVRVTFCCLIWCTWAGIVSLSILHHQREDSTVHCTKSACFV